MLVEEDWQDGALAALADEVGYDQSYGVRDAGAVGPLDETRARSNALWKEPPGLRARLFLSLRKGFLQDNCPIHIDHYITTMHSQKTLMSSSGTG